MNVLTFRNNLYVYNGKAQQQYHSSLFQHRINCFKMRADITSYVGKRWGKEQRQAREDTVCELQNPVYKTCLSSLT